MFELDVRVASDARSSEAMGRVEMPTAFMLIGQGGANVLGGQTTDAAWVVDAEGVVLRGGATYAWCRSGCCESPRHWPSVEAAADFHGSLILDGDGCVRAPREAVSREATPGDVVPGGDGPEAG